MILDYVISKVHSYGSSCPISVMSFGLNFEAQSDPGNHVTLKKFDIL